MKRRQKKSIKQIKDERFGFLMSLPAMIFLALLFVFPIIYSFGASFTNYRLVGQNKLSFVGLENYIKAFTEPDFFNSVKITLLITVGALVVEFLLAMLLAGLIVNIKKGQGILKTIYLIPMMVAPTVAGLLFRFMLNDDFGLLNVILKSLGIVSSNVHWLTDSKIVLASIIYVDSWTTIPFIFLLMYTGLSSVSEDVIESGKIDGANRFQIFFRIQIPIIKPTLIIALVIRFMDVFRIFDSIYVLTDGGPGKASETLSLLIYKTNWHKYQVGYASALSYIMLIFMIAVALLIQYIGKDKEERKWKRHRKE